jgi:hypothetical protein
MTKKIATRGGQYPLVAEFTFDPASDTMQNTAGADDSFASVGSHSFDVINLPAGAVVVSGDVTTEVAVSGSAAYNVSVGDAANPARYLAATDRVAAGTTPLVPTGYLSTGGQVRLTVSPTTAAATAGRLTVRVGYVIRNRMNEVQTH